MNEEIDNLGSVEVHKKPHGFILIDHKPIDDPNLGWRAKGILTYLIGKPEGWVIRIKDIIKRSTDKHTAVYTALRQLRAQGYAKIKVVRENGRIKSRRWVVAEYKLDDLQRDFLSGERLNGEKPPYSKNKGIKKNEFHARSAQRGVCDSFGLNGQVKLPSVVTKFNELSTINRWYVGMKGSNGKGWTHQTLVSWAKLYQKLKEELGGDVSRIKEVFNWFAANKDLDYTPKAMTFRQFFEKFGRIESAMKRDQKPSFHKAPRNLVRVINERRTPQEIEADEIEAAMERQESRWR